MQNEFKNGNYQKSGTEVKEMKIYIFRHAEKASDYGLDPALSARGFQQAENLALAVKTRQLAKPSLIISSPKIRTQQTMKALSLAEKIPLKTDPRLFERHANENRQQMNIRIIDFIQEICTQSDDCLFICSHYDWVAYAMQLIQSDIDLSEMEYQHWEPCQYVGFEIKDNFFHFIERKIITPL